MPIYRFSCQCGLKDFSQFLKVDKETVPLKCQACGRTNSAHQVRDKTAIMAENNEVRGVLRRDKQQ